MFSIFAKKQEQPAVPSVEEIREAYKFVWKNRVGGTLLFLGVVFVFLVYLPLAMISTLSMIQSSAATETFGEPLFGYYELAPFFVGVVFAAVGGYLLNAADKFLISHSQAYLMAESAYSQDTLKELIEDTHPETRVPWRNLDEVVPSH